MRQDLRPDVKSVERSGHNAERSVTALGSFVEEIFIEMKHAVEVCFGGSFHYLLIVDGTLGIVPVRAVILKLVREVAACNDYRIAAQRLSNFPDIDAKLIVVSKRKP